MISNTQRKIVILLFAGIILVLAIWQWAVIPLVNYQKRLDQTITINTTRLEKLLRLESQLKKILETNLKPTPSQGNLPRNFTLFSYLDRLATQNQVKKNVDFLRPSSKNINNGVSMEIVDLRLKKVRLGKLIPFLTQIESSPYGISIDRLIIRTEKKTGLLDVDITCSILKQD
ncbi:hypothetical protein KFV02_01315 [Desulfohalobiaceae bacterium Ax17]|uniref:hypothetical protein n=1 Tax=Desulfovulcanus ferrireducens TaxID=2831190 RepID=UPI00207BC8C8|nr:hypothetical protein [Desulfovulcanus ferrireducens]MBT8762571.1 hypothetical protein [Desulfovulcanus ferrireducens]